MSTDRRRNQIPRSQILDLGDYERQRDEIRSKAIEARRLRRIELGPNATLAFENHETVAYQIQEMLRAERIAKEPEVAHEIETYSDLLPAGDELSATLMFEFPEADGRNVRLRDLLGFEETLRIEFAGAGSAAAWFDRRQIGEEQLSAVQFVRFAVDPQQRRLLEEGAGVSLVADHPSYSWRVDLSRELCRALSDDLASADRVAS